MKLVDAMDDVGYAVEGVGGTKLAILRDELGDALRKAGVDM